MNHVKRFIARAAYTPATKRNYTQNLGYFSDWWNGQSAAEITPEDFLEFLDTKVHWSDSQRHGSLAALKAYIRAMYGELDDGRRTREILLFKVRREQTDEQRILMPEEIEKLMSCLDPKRIADFRNLVMMLLSLDCRLRSSEICNLKLNQIDFDGGRTHPDSMDGGVSTIVTRRKGGKRKPAGFSDYTRTYLKAYLVERRSIARVGVDEVFVNVQGIHKGLKVSPDHWRIVCRRWAVRAGIPHFSPHCFCRSFAYFSRLQGAQTHLVAMAGGWTDDSMVALYDRRLAVQEFKPYLPTILLSGLKGEPPVAAEGSER